MTDRTAHASKTGELAREFSVDVELYVSNPAGAGLRKPASRSKKSDKRDAFAGIVDDPKLKEKPSWFGLSTGLAGSGQWRSATCTLQQEENRCFLHIYVDECILFQTIFIHLLNQTDIRRVDNSLLCRKGCVGIYCIAGQRWNSLSVTEPVYLYFDDDTALATWVTLLKAHSIPEIYGRWFSEAGSYRVWRRVELTIKQGRNLGSGKLHETETGPTHGEANHTEVDFSCEIQLNDIMCGRTTAKKGVVSPDWYEEFVFDDLPPFDELDIDVWREKKLSRPAVVGTARLRLSNFRRGEEIEGWFPLVYSENTISNYHVGELKLKIKIDEEIILPYSVYSDVLSVLRTRNLLDWMSDFESKLKMTTLSMPLMFVAIADGGILEQIREYAGRHMDESTTSQQTLFRGNTVLTKLMESYLAWYGQTFLEASIGSVLRRLCSEKVTIEVDPMRSGKGNKDVDRNVVQLLYWCREFLDQIYSAKAECPIEIRKLLEIIRELVEKRYGSEQDLADMILPKQSVSAFIFLRLIVPAILHPHLFGLLPGLPSAPVQRSLTLIAKVIQSLANLNTNIYKENFMRGVTEFMRDSLPVMVDYLMAVSTSNTTSSPDSSTSADVSQSHNRLTIVHYLGRREKVLSTLERESIPLLPYLLDLPRHLALIISTVIRYSRDLRSQTSDSRVDALQQLYSKCLEVEAHALFRVNQLAKQLKAAKSRTPVPTHFSGISFPVLEVLPVLHSREQHLRPMATSTDPGSQSLDQLMIIPEELSSSHTLTISYSGPESDFRSVSEQWRHHNLHMKSPSLDSVLSYDAGHHNIQQGRGTETVVTETIDETGKQRMKGILKGILRR